MGEGISKLTELRSTATLYYYNDRKKRKWARRFAWYGLGIAQGVFSWDERERVGDMAWVMNINELRRWIGVMIPGMFLLDR